MALSEGDLSNLVPYRGDLGADERMAISGRALDSTPTDLEGPWATIIAGRAIVDNTASPRRLRDDADNTRNLTRAHQEDFSGF